MSNGELGQASRDADAFVIQQRQLDALTNRDVKSLKEPQRPPPVEAERARQAAVEATSRQLQAQLDASKREEFRFEHANARPYQPLTPAVERLVERAYQVDVEAAFDRAEKWLRVRVAHQDRGHVAEELDQGEEIAREVHKMWMTVKAERENWEDENAAVFGAMWEAASALLQAEKDSKARNKTITDADVRARAATEYPDEWGVHEHRKRRAKGLEASCANLYDLVVSKIFTLRSMYDKHR